MRCHSRVLLYASLLIAARFAAPCTGSAQSRPLELEDLAKYELIQGTEVSPDGRHILYALSTTDVEKNTSGRDIWMVAAAGGEAIKMTHAPASEWRPRWASDSRSFAFLTVSSESGGRAAIHRLSVSTGKPELLYAHPTSISRFEWAPDGRSIAFTAADSRPEQGESDPPSSFEIEGTGAGTVRQLWLLDVPARQARQLTRGENWSIGEFGWSPDSRRLVYSAVRDASESTGRSGELFVLDGLEEKLQPRRLTHTRGPEFGPQWTPDGRWIVFRGRSPEGYKLGYRRHFRVPVSGGEPEDISPKLDVDPTQYIFADDGRAVLFTADTETTRGVFYMPLSSREAVRMTPEHGVYWGLSVSPETGRLSFVHETPDQPGEVHTAVLRPRVRGGSLGRLSKLTDHNAEMVPLVAGRTEVVRWRSVDGLPLEGLVVYPASWRPSDGPRAMVVRIHGGPDNVWSQEFMLNGLLNNAQYYAADGYVTFLPNPRGSTGYGDEGELAVNADWGGLDFHDIMTGIDTLVARRVAHPDSLGIQGWSYGGYMSAWAITQTDRFKAAGAGAAITEPISFWGASSMPETIALWFEGHPFGAAGWKEYLESSPLAHVHQVKTPTLLMHGVRDAAVPPQQALIFYRALQAIGVPSALVWLPRTGHTPSEPIVELSAARINKEWMDHWIRARPITDSTIRGILETGRGAPVR